MDRKSLFERSLWQRTELLKLLETLNDEQWRSGHLDSVYAHAFEIVKHEWEMLERIEGREPIILNDDELDGDPAGEIPPHAITIVWLRSRLGQLSLWRQNEARKADLLLRYEELDLDSRIQYTLAPTLPLPGMGPREMTLSLANIIDMMWQPLTIGIRGLRYALGVLGKGADLARIFSAPHEGPAPGPAVEFRPYTGA